MTQFPDTVEKLVKRLTDEEARMVRLFDHVVAERDKRDFGPAGFTVLNGIKHAVSGRDPVLTDAADTLTAQAAEIVRLTAERDELDALLNEGIATDADTYQQAFDAGLDAAAKWVAKRCDDYVKEHGSYDYSTGQMEFPGNGEEYVGELEEIEEGIRLMKGATK
jgi:hypothetical protein